MENKKTFYTKLSLFTLFAFILPIVYMSIRFNLFVSKSRLSLWGLLLIALVMVVFAVMIKFYLDGMKTKWSYGKQLVKGFVKVILPLLFVLVLSLYIKNHLDEFIRDINLIIEAISVIAISEAIAIAVNPLSKWAFENNVDGLVQITDRIIGREK